MLAPLLLTLLAACHGPGDTGFPQPTLGDLVQVVPSAGLPPEITVQDANNNLDVLDVDDTIFLAWRTAPTHFASEEATIYVVSSTDEEQWGYETTVHLGTDVREPRLAYLRESRRLFLYFAVLGTDPFSFEPQGTMYVVREHDGTWSEPAWLRQDTFIPWRVRAHQGQPQMMGYTGGDQIYDPDGLPQMNVEWLTSHDGVAWEPVAGASAVVHTGGASETDFRYLNDGSLVAVLRNEAGDEGGFGSLICTAQERSLGSWECVHDLKKYDSPLVLGWGDTTWLIARRNLTETGNYDLEQGDLNFEARASAYATAYSAEPKRCSLWQVFPQDKVVLFTLDLPSKGDTCFPAAIDRGAGAFTVYNYSNDVEGEDYPWIQGQVQPTFIYRQDLQVP
ncbi:MAG: hypothetical protein ABIO70_18480 [Pseudomonadota bacterium]